MKRVITLLISIAFSVTSFAAPQTISGADFSSQINMEKIPLDLARHVNILTSRSDVKKTKFTLSKNNGGLYTIKQGRQKMSIKHLNERNFLINGKKFQLDKNDSTQIVLHKIEKLVNKHQVSVIDFLLFNQAKAIVWFYPIAVIAIAAAVGNTQECNQLLSTPQKPRKLMAELTPQEQKQCSAIRKQQRKTQKISNRTRTNYGMGNAEAGGNR